MNIQAATNKQLQIIMNYDNEISNNLLKQVIYEMIDRGLMKSFITYCSMTFWGKHNKNKYILGLELADIIQLGYVGLLKALNRFNPGKMSFATFSRYYIKAEWQSAIRKFNTEKRSSERNGISINQKINDEGTTICDLIPSTKNLEKKVLLKVHFESQLENLTPKQKFVIIKHLQGYQTKEIGLMIGSSRQNIEKHFYNALKIMGVNDYSVKGA